jgi:hypothetical protein
MLSPDEMNVILLEERDREIRVLKRLLKNKRKPLTEVQIKSIWEDNLTSEWFDPTGMMVMWTRLIEKAHGIK